MEYKIKKIVEEIDEMTLDDKEFNDLNELFRSIARKNYPYIAASSIESPITKIIMLNDNSVRIEMLVNRDHLSIHHHSQHQQEHQQQNHQEEEPSNVL